MRKAYLFIVALAIVIGLGSIPFAQDKPAKKVVPGSKFITDAARDGLFHVEAAKLAVQRASSEGVKKFGQHSVEHHTTLNDELAKLAGTKGVTLPKQMSKEQKEALDKVAKLSGPDFDKAYLELEIKHHSKDFTEFQKEAKDGKDPDVKAWAAKAVAAIEEHLEMARALRK